MREYLYGIDQPFLLVGMFVLATLGTELGYRLGRAAPSRADPAARSSIAILQSASLGLLALLLGFTFSMSETRFEARKHLALEEANAIATTWLRAGLLPPAYAASAREHLGRYLEANLVEHGPGRDVERRAAAEATNRLQRVLWREGERLAAEDPRRLTTTLYLQSLNQTIDLDEARRVANENHVPEPTLYLLAFVAVASFVLVGFGAGLVGWRQLGASALMAFIVTVVILLIVDLDRPVRGHIRVSQASMLRLRESVARGLTP